MALLMVQEGVQPAGQFDNLDGYAPKGGEVYVLYSKGVGSDGYQIVSARPAVTGDGYAFYLVDDGLTGYGVLFGNTVTRTATGFTSGADTATRLGPHSAAGSGKLTLWDKPGLYAVTLDALFDNETSLKAALPGATLTCETATGKLKLGNMGAGAPIATVVTYKIDESLVTTGGAVVSHKKLVIRFNGAAGVV
jgi:hypothetical protein